MEDLLGAFGFVMLGFLLLAIEAFIVPGFGLFGVLGLSALGVGTYVAWVNRGPAVGVAVMAGSAAVSVVLGVLFARSRMAKRMVLSDAVRGEAVDRAELNALIGRSGTAASVLRPSGTALIDGERIQVMTEGEFVKPGTPVRVIAMGTNCAVVEVIQDAPAAGTAPDGAR